MFKGVLPLPITEVTRNLSFLVRNSYQLSLATVLGVERLDGFSSPLPFSRFRTPGGAEKADHRWPY